MWILVVAVAGSCSVHVAREVDRDMGRASKNIVKYPRVFMAKLLRKSCPRGQLPKAGSAQRQVCARVPRNSTKLRAWLCQHQNQGHVICKDEAG
jgi:hypothetical protein